MNEADVIMSEYPRITYQYSGRAFDRLFKEQSLDETKVVVRKKLGLSHDAPIDLVQMRDGKKVDLEDDDDFEAFKALTKTSLHATVAVIIPENESSPNSVDMNASREGKGHPNDPHPEPHAREAAQSVVVAPITESPLQSPVTHATGTLFPRKKRKVAFDDDDTVTHPQHTHQPPSSSREVPPTVIHDSTSEAVALPPSTPRSQTQTTDSGRRKRKAAKITPSDVDVDPAKATAESSRKKQKKINGAPLPKESPPEHEASKPASVGMPSGTQKKGKKQSRLADTETGGAKSKTRSIDRATDEMPG
ncbi:hypothetical protein BC827DRAFT_342753 [Russula dissimulans]|nr:hypothetical protein BC827DRAFT_342753 [Russula dissimulans]